MSSIYKQAGAEFGQAQRLGFHIKDLFGFAVKDRVDLKHGSV